jgi:hypothetical protein
MPSSTMWTNVLQATAIFTFSEIIIHHISNDMVEQITNNEGYANFTNAMNNSMSFNSTNDAPRRLTIDAGGAANITSSLNRTTSLVNKQATNSMFSMTGNSEEPFYSTLPREVFIHFVLYTLQYCWFIGLEKMLPARPKRREVLHEGKEKVEENEDREEEVVKKWVAQGRVRRASLNWCNTFLKWMINMTVGRLWFHATGLATAKLLELQSPKLLFKGFRSVSRPPALL